MVEPLVKKTAQTLNAAVHEYWSPRSNGKIGNALPERSLIVHFAHACMSSGCHVYPEAAHHGDADEVWQTVKWIDMLAYRPGSNSAQIRIEAKRFHSLRTQIMQGMYNDVHRIRRFVPNDNDNTYRQVGLNAGRKVGLILAITHMAKPQEWWLEPTDQHPNLQQFLNRPDTVRDICPFESNRKPDAGQSAILYAAWDLAGE
ncbi:MAG: hypothetical protein HY985_14025 [Magnetospirillum sp.]|nr:hypothetical protein [Magnetospirillum sp.]